MIKQGGRFQNPRASWEGKQNKDQEGKIYVKGEGQIWDYMGTAKWL